VKRVILVCFLLAFVAMLGAVANAQAPTITVDAAVSPNVFDSPNWNAWVSNSIDSLLASNGNQPWDNAVYNAIQQYGPTDPSSPAYYQSIAGGTATIAQTIVSTPPSWNGVVNPDPNGPYGQEYGSRVVSNVEVDGNGTMFALSDLMVNATIDGVSEMNWYFDGMNYGDYNNMVVGVINNPDHSYTILDMNNPANTDTMVNEAFLVGTGGGYWWFTGDNATDVGINTDVYGNPLPGLSGAYTGNLQQDYNTLLASVSSLYSGAPLEFDWTLGAAGSTAYDANNNAIPPTDVLATGSTSLTLLPEPSCFALVGGLGLLWLARRRRA